MAWAAQGLSLLKDMPVRGGAGLGRAASWSAAAPRATFLTPFSRSRLLPYRLARVVSIVDPN